MKFHVILRKKHIVLASLVLVLSAAIYLNYVFSLSGQDYDITSTLGETNVSQNVEETYGEAQLTSGTEGTDGIVAANEYFAEARLDRKQARDEAVETLATTLKDAELSDDDKELATSKALAVSKQIESENKIETLVKAKGFTECLAFVDDESVRVMVQTEGLSAEQAAQIKNIILETTDVLPENISVAEVV